MSQPIYVEDVFPIELKDKDLSHPLPPPWFYLDFIWHEIFKVVAFVHPNQARFVTHDVLDPEFGFFKVAVRRSKCWPVFDDGVFVRDVLLVDEYCHGDCSQCLR